MTGTHAVRYDEQIPDMLKALGGVHHVLTEQGLDRTIHNLVQLRASQINRCAHCLKMHLKEARRDGETDDRLDRLAVWEHVSDFTAREKAALAWTEALTLLDRRTDYGALRAALREHFSEREIGLLTTAVAMINMWNRIQVSRH